MKNNGVYLIIFAVVLISCKDPINQNSNILESGSPIDEYNVVYLSDDLNHSLCLQQNDIIKIKSSRRFNIEWIDAKCTRVPFANIKNPNQLRQISSTYYSFYNCDGKILSTYVYFPGDEIYINDDACFIHFLTDKEIYIEVSS